MTSETLIYHNACMVEWQWACTDLVLERRGPTDKPSNRRLSGCCFIFKPHPLAQLSTRTNGQQEASSHQIASSRLCIHHWRAGFSRGDKAPNYHPKLVFGISRNGPSNLAQLALWIHSWSGKAVHRSQPQYGMFSCFGNPQQMGSHYAFLCGQYR